MPSSKLTVDQVSEMLKELSDHFGEPVKPISQYCDAMRTWAKCMRERERHLVGELLPDTKGSIDSAATRLAWETFHTEIAKPDRLMGLVRAGQKPTQWDYDFDALRSLHQDLDSISRVELLISKSSLLNRLIYVGEKLRTEMCPIHKGHWSGLEFGGNDCPHRCHLTGWIVQPEDAAKYDIRLLPECPTCHKPYVKDDPKACDNFYHCCRDCRWVWDKVEVFCETHAGK